LAFSQKRDESLACQTKDDTFKKETYWSKVIMSCTVTVEWEVRIHRIDSRIQEHPRYSNVEHALHVYLLLMVTRKKVQVQVSKEISAVDSIFPNTKDYHVRMPCHHIFRFEFREPVRSYLAKLKAEKPRESRHHAF
jgi:hypothetical protein